MQARRFEYIPDVIYHYKVDNLASLVHQTWRKKTPKCLDHVFMVYASLQYMKKKEIELYNMYVLELVLREVGPILKSRTGRKYYKVAFALSCCMVDEILSGIEEQGKLDETIEYIRQGKLYKILQACLNKNIIQWEMACWIV